MKYICASRDNMSENGVGTLYLLSHFLEDTDSSRILMCPLARSAHMLTDSVSDTATFRSNPLGTPSDRRSFPRDLKPLCSAGTYAEPDFEEDPFGFPDLVWAMTFRTLVNPFTGLT